MQAIAHFQQRRNLSEDPRAVAPRRSQVRRPGASILLTSLLGAVLLLVVLVPRWNSLDALVTPDEPLWVARSANFYEALASGQFEDTYQFSHPGVTLMWLGTLGHWLVDPALPDRTTAHIETADVRDRVLLPGELPIERLVSLRKPVIVANAVAILVLFLTLIPLVGRWPAFICVAYLSLDPMQIGFSRLLHLDGLSTNLLLVTLCSFTWHLERRSRLALVVSGIAAGLALLTRSVNGILLLVVMMVVVIDLIRLTGFNRTHIRRLLPGYLARTAVWGSIALVTVLILWPALWVAPIATIEELVRGGSDLAAAAHTRQVLFRGEVISSDPGLSYYPIVLAYRTNVLTIAGLILALLMGIWGYRVAPNFNRRLCLNLVTFAALYIFILTLAAKKLDRYLLPSLAALHLVAALGAIASARWLTGYLARNRPQIALVAVAAVGAVLLGLQALTAAKLAPYYITYVSPLMGGARGARDEISLGWGEGGKSIAEAILAHPEMDPDLIKGGAWPATIHYYLPENISRTNWELSGAGAAWFIESHYVIVTEPEVQRQLFPASMIRWFEARVPILTVWDDGRVYARIFDISSEELPEPYFLVERPIVRWGEVTLLAGTVKDEISPGDDVRVRLFFETTGAPFRYSIRAKVVDEQGNEIGAISNRFRAEEPVGPEIKSVFDIELPPDLPLGSYTVYVAVSDRETGDQLTGVHVVTGEATERFVLLGTFSVVQGDTESEA